MIIYDDYDYHKNLWNAKDPAPIPLIIGKTYSYFLEGTLENPIVLLLREPEITADGNSLRAFCVMIDSGTSGIKAGVYCAPLAQHFRNIS